MFRPTTRRSRRRAGCSAASPGSGGSTRRCSALTRSKRSPCCGGRHHPGERDERLFRPQLLHFESARERRHHRAVAVRPTAQRARPAPRTHRRAFLAGASAVIRIPTLVVAWSVTSTTTVPAVQLSASSSRVAWTSQLRTRPRGVNRRWQPRRKSAWQADHVRTRLYLSGAAQHYPWVGEGGWEARPPLGPGRPSLSSAAHPLFHHRTRTVAWADKTPFTASWPRAAPARSRSPLPCESSSPS